MLRVLKPMEYLRGEIDSPSRGKVDDLIRAIRQEKNLSERELLRALFVVAYRLCTELPVNGQSVREGIDAPRMSRPDKTPEGTRNGFVIPTFRECFMELVGVKFEQGASACPSPE